MKICISVSSGSSFKPPEVVAALREPDCRLSHVKCLAQRHVGASGASWLPARSKQPLAVKHRQRKKGTMRISTIPTAGVPSEYRSVIDATPRAPFPVFLSKPPTVGKQDGKPVFGGEEPTGGRLLCPGWKAQSER